MDDIPEDKTPIFLSELFRSSRLELSVMLVLSPHKHNREESHNPPTDGNEGAEIYYYQRIWYRNFSSLQFHSAKIPYREQFELFDEILVEIRWMRDIFEL
jgi:hypothetical protein